MSHQRPDGTSDHTVAAVGKVTEALEWVERARGHLYEFHQMMGHADACLAEAVDNCTAAGHGALVATTRRELVGRDVLDGRWTFQVVEEFDDGYYAAFKAEEARIRDALMAGRRHVFEAEMKHGEQNSS